MRNRTTIGISLALVVVVAAMAIWAVASTPDEESDPGAGNPESRAVDYERALAGAPPELAELYADGDALLPGGPEELESLLAEVEGRPAVVNVWASWCGPCREEFPFFQELGAELGDDVAFIGVNSEDGDGADGGSADTFLDQFPLPYPSVVDPRGEYADAEGIVGLPGTVFYDAAGERTFVHQGPYTSAAQLEREIERYATP